MLFPNHNGLALLLSSSCLNAVLLLQFLFVSRSNGRIIIPDEGVDLFYNNGPWGNAADDQFAINNIPLGMQQQQKFVPQLEDQLIGGGDDAADEATDGAERQQQQLSFTLQLPSNIGQTAGLALDPKNRLVIFHRSGRVWDEYSFNEKNQFNRSLGAIPNATLAVLDSETGKILEEHGRGKFYMPHGLTIDAHGNHWLTDVGSHQVHKLDAKFQPLMTLGEKMVPGSDGKHFCKPTDVAVVSTGEFFVADGYCNSRIMKFDREGKLLSQFGHSDSSHPAKNGEFLVPHSLALIEDLNLLCVADRENERIQCFSAGLEGTQRQHRRAYVPTGTFFTKAENIGRVFAIREKQHFLVGVTDRDQRGQLEPQVFVMDMNTGHANSFAKGLENAHAVALSDNGEIYVSQLVPNQIVKFSMGGGNANNDDDVDGQQQQQ